MNPTQILALVNAALLLIEKIGPAVSALKQSAELTPEQEAELDKRLADIKSAAHWQV